MKPFLVSVLVGLAACGTELNINGNKNAPDTDEATATATAVDAATDTVTTTDSDTSTDTSPSVPKVSMSCRGSLESDSCRGFPSDTYVNNTLSTIKKGQTWSTMLPEAKNLILKYGTCQQIKNTGGTTRQECGVEKWISCNAVADSDDCVDDKGSWVYYWTFNIKSDGTVTSVFDGRE